MTKVLAIETSCDETAASVVTNKSGIYNINSRCFLAANSGTTPPHLE